MNQRQLEKTIKESVHAALEPFRLAYTEQANENIKLAKALRDITIAYAESMLGKNGATPTDSK